MMTFFHGIDVPLVPWRTQSLVPMALVHLAYGAPNPGALGALAQPVLGASDLWYPVPWCLWSLAPRALVPLYASAPGP